MDIPKIGDKPKISLGWVMAKTFSITLPAVFLPLAILLPLGWYLDARLGTKPWGMVACLAVSFVMTNVIIFWKVRKLGK